MATGIVVGLSRQRDSWGSRTGRPDDISFPASSSQAALPIMSSSGHHRSYSDAPGNSNRFRLPPISNLIEGAGRPELSYRPSYPGPKTHVQPSTQQVHGSSTSPNTAAWSPPHNRQLSYQQDPRKQYESQPVSEQYYALNDYGQAGGSISQSTSAESRYHSSHGPPRPNPDPLSPVAGATTARRVIGEEIYAGEGLCYVYDDGSHVPKIINGDTVNPKWGTTKAGKPRKRLGQACNTCREKKIKCDPSFPKCTQCQKFGRECRFEAPSRVTNKSPKLRTSGSPTATTLSEEHRRTRRPSLALTETSSHSESGTISSRAAGTADDNLSPVTNDSNFLSDAQGPSKKARLMLMDAELLPDQRTLVYPRDHHCDFALEVDPFKVNKKVAEAYLVAYFNHINRSTFSLLPERPFLHWAESAEDKSPASKLVLYCMLALGCSFSKASEKSSHGNLFASIALEGVMQSFGHFSVQLIQARLIFALCEFQNGREERAWDLCGAAMRTACAMNLNTEEGIAQQMRENHTIYGLDQARLAECLRRTFWMAYTMDSLGVACLSITATFNRTDCYLRLPCTRQAYEKGHIPKTPIFDGEIHPIEPDAIEEQSHVSSLGYLMQIAALCCDVRALVFRASHHAKHGRSTRYNTAREEIEIRLRIWNDNYTAHINRMFLQRSTSRMAYPFSFGGLHLMYHYACMQLHRHVPHSQLSRGQISEHVQMAYYHAEKTLAIAEEVMSRKSHDIYDHHFAVSSPLSGYAIHYAIDILSAAGINAKVLENHSSVLGLMINSVQLLDSLTEIWSSAKIQQSQVSDRVRLVMHSARAGIAEGKIGFCMEEPMVTSLSKEEDLVYGVDRMQYLKSFAWAEQIQGPSDLNAISSKGKRESYSIWKD